MRMAALFAGLTFVAGAVGDELRFETLAKQFEYDAKAPLDVQMKPQYERDGVKAFDASYVSPKGGRVTAYVVRPTAPGPHAGIVFGHWGPGNRTEFLPEATIFARAGVVSVMIDYPWRRPAPWRKFLTEAENPEGDHAAFVQAVIDLRRAIDMLEADDSVDRKRIGYVGHSFGAQWGAILSAVEPRLKAVVLMAGTPDQAAIWRDNNDPSFVEFRKGMPKAKLDAFLNVMERTSAVRYVSHSKAPLFFQFAKHEQYFDKAAMNRYYAAAKEPKSVKWYDTGHELNDPQALADRAAWLGKRLGFKAKTGSEGN